MGTLRLLKEAHGQPVQLTAGADGLADLVHVPDVAWAHLVANTAHEVKDPRMTGKITALTKGAGSDVERQHPAAAAWLTLAARTAVLSAQTDGHHQMLRS